MIIPQKISEGAKILAVIPKIIDLSIGYKVVCQNCIIEEINNRI
jgi:hypothetical protein